MIGTDRCLGYHPFFLPVPNAEDMLVTHVHYTHEPPFALQQ